jgi:AcrR family transcriptional regulator
VSILTSPAHDESNRAQYRPAPSLLIPACRAVASGPHTSVKADRRLTASAHSFGQRYLSSRREQLILVAAREFRLRGYGGVSLDDFGAGIGVAGPTLYRYFDSKSDLLAVIVSRFHEWVTHESVRAVSEARTDSGILERLVGGYMRVALEATDLLAVAVSELMYLQPEIAEKYRKIRIDHLNEWVLWLGKALPTLDTRSARILANAARVTIDDLVRIRHLRQTPKFPELLNSCVLSILRLQQGPEDSTS